jgi:hypothetical protein
MKPALENTKIAKTSARCDARNFLAFLVLPFSQIMYSPAFRDGPTFFILPSEILCACPCPFSLPSPTIRLSPMEGVTHSTFSVVHSKIGARGGTIIFNRCSIPHDAKPRPRPPPPPLGLYVEPRAGRRGSHGLEGACGGARVGKKELVWMASPNNGWQR